MKPQTRTLLEEAAAYGKRNSGCGFTTAKLIREALAVEDIDQALAKNTESTTND
jgi:hypothetical protein